MRCPLILLTGLASLFCNTTCAQLPEFAPVGAIWHYTEVPLEGGLRVRELTSVDTATFLGQPCKEMYGESAAGQFYAYRESLRMYVAHSLDTAWRLLYDFTLGVGDTFVASFDIHSVPVEVIDTGHIIINGFKLPTMETMSLDHNFFFDGLAILNIGSADYFVPAIGWADPPTYGLRCYTDTIIGNYQLAGVCDTTIYVQADMPSSSMHISPNPTTGLVSVHLPSAEQASVVVTDKLGRIVSSVHILTGEGATTIDLSDLPTGSYYLNIWTENGRLGKQVLLIR